jgi:HAE1 family hydrophobic/amphiphilic exporter-1/multidrug efflux pump
MFFVVVSRLFKHGQTDRHEEAETHVETEAGPRSADGTEPQGT